MKCDLVGDRNIGESWRANGEPATADNREANCREATAADIPQNGELRQRVRLFLAASNLPALRHLEVEAQGDAIVLSGIVRTYYEKQMAAKFASRVAGVIHVVDQIEVRNYVPLPRRGRLEAAGRYQPLAR